MKQKNRIQKLFRIVSIIFFSLAIFNFIISIATLTQYRNNDDVYNPLMITFIIFASFNWLANIALMGAMFLMNKNNYKNPMFYLLIFIFVFTILDYSITIANLNKYIKVTLYSMTAEFWFLLIGTGLSVVIGTWNFLEELNLVRKLTRFIPSLSEEDPYQELLNDQDEKINELEQALKQKQLESEKQEQENQPE